MELGVEGPLEGSERCSIEIASLSFEGGDSLGARSRKLLAWARRLFAVPVRAHLTGDSRNKTLLQVFGKDSPIAAARRTPCFRGTAPKNSFIPFETRVHRLHSAADDAPSEFVRRKGIVLKRLSSSEDGVFQAQSVAVTHTSW